MNEATKLTWKCGEAAAEILPGRGRLLGIKVKGHNLLWSPAKIENKWNLGGERLWIGPEADWFWKKTDKVDFEQYQVPAGLDPDEWRVTGTGETSCVAELSLQLRCAHSEKHLDLGLTRAFELLPEELLADAGVNIALQITTSIEIRGGTPGQPVDLWSILQVPFGGKMQVPVIGTPVVRDYFDPCPAEDKEIQPGLFGLKIGGGSVFKLGLDPSSVGGRIAYARPVAEGMLVLSRSFPNHPAMRYCDAPLAALGTQGDAIQFFNDGGTMGNFGEMEHRSPALFCSIGPQRYVETTVTTVSLQSPPEYRDWLARFVRQPSGEGDVNS